MEIPFQSMAVDAGIVVAVPVQQIGKIGSGIRQILNMESYVLDETGGANAPHASDGRKYSGADGPVS